MRKVTIICMLIAMSILAIHYLAHYLYDKTMQPIDTKKLEEKDESYWLIESYAWSILILCSIFALAFGAFIYGYIKASIITGELSQQTIKELGLK